MTPVLLDIGKQSRPGTGTTECEWKLTTVDPQERSTWRSGVRSAMHAASQLQMYLEGGPLMWMMPLQLHVNQTSDYDMMRQAKNPEKLLSMPRFKKIPPYLEPWLSVHIIPSYPLGGRSVYLLQWFLSISSQF